MSNIVFYGGAGAGKSTAADILTNEFDYKKVSFATPLKAIVADLWGTEDPKTKREYPQQLGVAVRDIEPDTWANLLFAEVDNNPDVEWVNDDCRFPNEYWGLKERGFIFVRVLASESLRVDRLLRIGKLNDTSQLEHESETALVGMKATKEGIVDDYTIFNNGDMDELRQNIANVLLDAEERA